MKWTSKRGSRLQSQKGCRVFVCLLLVVMLAIGAFALGRIPVARAGTGDFTVMGGTPTWVKWGILNTTQLYFAVAFSAAAPAANDRLGAIPSGTVTTSWGATLYGGNLVHALGQPVGTLFSAWYVALSKSVVAGTRVTVHLNAVVCGNGDYWHSCSFPANNLVFTAPTLSDGWRTWASVNGAVPLGVAMSGPVSIEKSVGGTWTAAASGGTGPYTYLWDYRSTEAYLNYGAGAFPGSSFHRVLTAGRWFVGVQATDSLGETATATLTVWSGASVGAYSLRFTRYGDYGRFIDVTAWDATGQALEITASSATQAGLPGTDGAFGWTDTANAVAVQDSWAWRYTVSLAVYGVTSPPPEMFWLKGAITVVGGKVLSFQHEFMSITEDYSTWFGPEGNPVLPETPPVPESVEPVWLTWLISKFRAMTIALFVPQMEDINRLLPTSYLVAEWSPIGPNTFANMTSDETFVIPVFGNVRFNLDEVPSGIWTACRVLTQVSISWSLIWVMLAVIG